MASAGAGVWLERAHEADAEALASIESRCHTHPWTLANFQEALRFAERGHVVLVLRSLASRDRGIRAYSALQSILDEGHIHNLAVHPDSRSRGLGRALLQESLRLLAQRGAKRMLLEVRRSNQPALALYRRLGFEIVGVRRDYYAEPREDALVLARG